MSLNFFFHTLIEFGPLTAFFLVSSFWGFYPGAMALVICVILTTIFSVIYFRRASYFSLILSAFIIVSGLATIYLHNPFWLVLEYTLTNLFFAAVLFYGHFTNWMALKFFFGHMFAISEIGWRRLNWNWAMIFLITGVLNQIFWHIVLNEDIWVIFRICNTIFIFFFGMYQFRISRDERLPGSSPWGLIS